MRWSDRAPRALVPVALRGPHGLSCIAVVQRCRSRRHPHYVPLAPSPRCRIRSARSQLEIELWKSPNEAERSWGIVLCFPADASIPGVVVSELDPEGLVVVKGFALEPGDVVHAIDGTPITLLSRTPSPPSSLQVVGISTARGHSPRHCPKHRPGHLCWPPLPPHCPPSPHHPRCSTILSCSFADRVCIHPPLRAIGLPQRIQRLTAAYQGRTPSS